MSLISAAHRRSLHRSPRGQAAAVDANEIGSYSPSILSSRRRRLEGAT